MTRLLRAAAVLLVAATATMFWVAPAQAAPRGLCTPAEWQEPSMFVECGNRLRQAIGDRAGCVHAPTPSSPTAGLAGWFTDQPDADNHPGVVGFYTVYGVAGYHLDTYDTGCASEITHPQATAQTAVASMMFTAAAGVIGATNGLRNYAYNPATMWGWADALLAGATNAIYRHIFMVVGGVMLAVAGLWLLSRARAGNLSEAMKVTGWALFALFLATAVVRWPVAAAHGADTVAGTGLRLVHEVLGPAPQNAPADKCVLSPAACIDSRSVSERASDTVTEAVLYRNWLRALLGSADSPTARTYGPALYDATTLTWAEADDIARNPELRQQVLDEKAHRFTAIAEQIKVEDPEAYANLQGLRGEDRIGSALVALLSAVIYAGFDMAASLVILLGFAVFRLAVIAIPLLAAVGVMLPASAGLRRVINATVAAVVNIVTFGAFGGLYLSFTGLIFNSHLPGPAQVVFVALAGAGCWLLLHPVRRLTHIATGTSKPGERGLLWKASTAVFDASQPVGGLIRRTATDVWRQATTNQPPTDSAPDGPTTGTADSAPVRPRPETTAGRSLT
jgi:hypothetical protein